MRGPGAFFVAAGAGALFFFAAGAGGAFFFFFAAGAGAHFFFVAGAVGARFFLLRVRSVFLLFSLYFTMKTSIFSNFQ